MDFGTASHINGNYKSPHVGLTQSIPYTGALGSTVVLASGESGTSGQRANNGDSRLTTPHAPRQPESDCRPGANRRIDTPGTRLDIQGQ
jgi:hypothetical protein